MDNLKRQRLKAAGWQVGTVADFLELSPPESEIVEFKALEVRHEINSLSDLPSRLKPTNYKGLSPF